MGRKRNQGRARKAAKAVEEAAKKSNNQTSDGQQLKLSLEAQMQQLQVGALIPPSQQHTARPCNHGLDPRSLGGICKDFMIAFHASFSKTFTEGVDTAGGRLWYRLQVAKSATMDKYADVWNDSAKIESVISYFLSTGTKFVLLGNDSYALEFAEFARFLEQHIAVEIHKTQAIINWPKICELQLDRHTLVKLFRKRIPCCCLEEKYHEVKSITKKACCYNHECHNVLVERSKTMYCSRCRSATYCSHECQKAHWKIHKLFCHIDSDVIAELMSSSITSNESISHTLLFPGSSRLLHSSRFGYTYDTHR
jgi:hypothetical protein